MAQTLWEEFDDLALELLSEDGVKTSITSQTKGDYDAEESQITLVPVEHACWALLFVYPTEFIDNTAIKDADSQAYVKMLDSYDPQVDDVFNWQGQQMKIISSRNNAPSGLTLFHVLQVRSG